MSNASTTPRKASGDGPQSARELNQRGDCEVGECEDFQTLVDDIGASVARYCRQRPTAAALGVFALGFFVGWKIKPW